MPRMVTVRFTKDFAPYRSGDTRKVRDDIGRKLMDEYKVAEIVEGGVTLIRVVKSLVSKLGPDWYPNSTHLADINLIKPYIDGGFVVIDGADEDDVPSVPVTHKPYPKPEPQPDWFKSHVDWNGVRVPVAIRCVALAAQCGDDRAESTLNAWISAGHMRSENGRVSW